jgi:hypothetical protein
MAFNKEIESCLEQIKQLERAFQEAQEMEILPISFFSANYDRVNVLKRSIYEMEETQCLEMQNHLKEEKEEEEEEELPIAQAKPLLVEEKEKESAANGFLGDKIGKTLFTDLKKSLSLNDRFRFQRDIFAGNAYLMEETLDYLSDLHSLDESIGYLNAHFYMNWEDESVVAFREILEKRFS